MYSIGRFFFLITIFTGWFLLAYGIVVPSGANLFSLSVLQVFAIMFAYLVGKSYALQMLKSPQANIAEKRKHIPTDPDAKMRLLLEMMDEDERYAFKQAMKDQMLRSSRDGELNYDADSLGALLDEDEPRRRQR